MILPHECAQQLRIPRNAGVAAALLALLVLPFPASAAWIWVEGEKPAESTMNRHPWWYDQVKREQLSGGDFISNFSEDKAGEAEYRFTAPEAGEYEFWVRANPIQARLSYRLNNAAWTEIDFGKTQLGNVNIAADNKPDLRFVAWIRVGPVTLRGGANKIRFRMDSQNNNHGSLDCFVLSNGPFQPQGILKPEQLAEAAQRIAAKQSG